MKELRGKRFFIGKKEYIITANIIHYNGNGKPIKCVIYKDINTNKMFSRSVRDILNYVEI